MDEDHPWWRDGVCAEIGPDLFFASADDLKSVEEAKQACGLCPVRLQCLADSLEADLEYGIFGGFARGTRRQLRVAVENGSDPMTVARRAIAQEKRKVPRHRWRARST